jgi:hypothetical protein
VLPGRKGDRATIEVRAGQGWRRSASVRLGPGGAYTAQVPRPGLYRTVYQGLAGPSVIVP